MSFLLDIMIESPLLYHTSLSNSLTPAAILSLQQIWTITSRIPSAAVAEFLREPSPNIQLVEAFSAKRYGYRIGSDQGEVYNPSPATEWLASKD